MPRINGYYGDEYLNFTPEDAASFGRLPKETSTSATTTASTASRCGTGAEYCQNSSIIDFNENYQGAEVNRYGRQDAAMQVLSALNA